jgi:trehalose synthase
VTRLDEYAAFAGQDVVDEIRLLAKNLRGKRILHVNSTSVGGGVAEILNRMVPLMSEMGLDVGWEVLKGGEAFYAATKKFHNALHGGAEDVTPRDYQAFEETTDANLKNLPLDADVLLIHDPQPAALVKKRTEKSRWIWRCHIDLSAPDPDVWSFLRPYISEYDACVYSAPAFAQKLPVTQVMVPPSIDPLSEKNRDLEESEVRAVLDRLQIPMDKPLVTQVSRFDRLKDPLGVIEAFQKAKPYVDARLLLVGGAADDDPEGALVLSEVREKAAGDPDVLVLNLPPTSHLEINAIQRASAVVLQKSVREGFGLTVSEALWKGKPVIAGAVGGIPLQIAHKYSGILVHSTDGAAYWLKQLLSEPDYAKKLGENGRAQVRQNFLLTRHLRDYLMLFLLAQNPAADVIRLE